MADDLPSYFFRLRENGAAVFRVETENRRGRIEMEQIAVANVKNGEFRAHGDRTLSEADRVAIRDWLAERQAQTARRELEDIQRTVDQLNLVAHWAQAKASDDQLEAVTNALLMAMHDLRTVLVRKKSERLAPGAE